MPTTALHTAWQLLTTLDAQLLAIVARSLSVSALACALGCAAGLVCGAFGDLGAHHGGRPPDHRDRGDG